MSLMLIKTDRTLIFTYSSFILFPWAPKCRNGLSIVGMAQYCFFIGQKPDSQRQDLKPKLGHYHHRN